MSAKDTILYQAKKELIVTLSSEGQKIYTVSEINRAVRSLVENSFIPFWICGEVGSLVVHNSGHVYMSLKDQKSQLRACWFGGAAECRKLGIDNGSLIEGFGSLSVYEVRGEYQFNLRRVRLAGAGLLQQKFEEVKNKLGSEGLFDAERKKPIPLLPKKIGVVTSIDGAALQDFLNIINRRNPMVDIRIYPSAVQGAGAARQIAAGVEFFNQEFPVDVIVVTRGGGSMEDLWEFNDETLARTVARSAIPVISAVGHEIDFTICDFVADLRVPTPSAAAELVISRRDELENKLTSNRRELEQLVNSALSNAKLRLQRIFSGVWLRDPIRLVADRRQYIDELMLHMERSADGALHRKFDALTRLKSTLDALDPQKQLERGYTIVTDSSGEKVITSSSSVGKGAKLNIQFVDGQVKVTAD